ncbi:hypothetical protein ACHAXT_011870 [Thalassiosira profunda]
MSDIDKKRPRTEGNGAPPSPIVHLNVGGARRDVRRSLLLALRDASKTADSEEGGEDEGEEGGGNPLVDVLLQGAEHWSNVTTTKDADGLVRIYLDREPEAFDDLLKYIQHGKDFIGELICKNSKEVGSSDGGLRLKQLRMEGDYFTVEALSEDIDCVLHGEPASFRADSWFTLAAAPTRNRQGAWSGWRWDTVTGSEGIASKTTERSLELCEVNETGTYLVFFSLHTVAVTALPPGHGYHGEDTDEFCTLGVFHDNATKSEGGHWTYALARCGAFDYREDKEVRRTQPLLVTAAFADPVSLRKGNLLYCQHGTGVVTSSPMQRIGDLVGMHSKFKSNPQCVSYLSLVRVFGDCIKSWNVQREKDLKAEPTTVKWTPGINDFSMPSETSLDSVSLDDGDATALRFKKAGLYLILGRVSARLRKDYDYELGEKPAVQLELCTKGGTPLLISPHLISWPVGTDDEPYDKRIAEYGPIRDVVCAEKDSIIRVKAVRGACFARHGTVPGEKIPTQNLSVLRLSPSARADRYQIYMEGGKLSFRRHLGLDEEATSERAPLFEIDDSDDRMTNNMSLLVTGEVHCIVVGSLPSLAASNATIMVNYHATIHSQLAKDSARGAHAFQGVLDLKKDDFVHIELNGGGDMCWDYSPNAGQLAFVVLDQ